MKAFNNYYLYFPLYFSLVVFLHSSSLCLRLLTDFKDPAQRLFLSFLSSHNKKITSFSDFSFTSLASMVFGKSAVNFTVVPWQHSRTGCFTDFSSVSLDFNILINWVRMYPTWSSSSFLEMQVSVTHHIWGVFGHCFFEYISVSFFFFQCFHYASVVHLMMTHLSEVLLFFSFILFFFFPVLWILQSLFICPQGCWFCNQIYC